MRRPGPGAPRLWDSPPPATRRPPGRLEPPPVERESSGSTRLPRPALPSFEATPAAHLSAELRRQTVPDRWCPPPALLAPVPRQPPILQILPAGEPEHREVISPTQLGWKSQRP